MKQQTAMQKLKQKLYLIIISNNMSTEFELALESVIDDIDRNFIQMEKEQMEMAVGTGISKADMTNNKGYFDFDKYYNDTFGENS